MARILSVLLLIAACDCSDDDASEPVAPASSGETEETPPPEPATEPIPEPVREGEPSGPPETVQLVGEAGITIVGTLRPGGRPDAPAVVLVHQLGSTRAEWGPLIEELSKPPGMTTLAFDMRGHGESTDRRGQVVARYQTFETADWEKVGRDVVHAVDLIEERDDLSPSRFAVVGSSIGSTAAFAAAAADPRLASVVALSPGRAYRGYDAITPAGLLTDRPLLLVAAEGELPAAEAAQNIDAMIGPSQMVLVPGTAHGVAMFSDDPSLPRRIEVFLRDPTALQPSR